MKYSIVMSLIMREKYQHLITIACLNNIMMFTADFDYELIVIHSLSHTYPVVQLLRPQDIYVPLNYNLSPAKSVNMGIEKASGEYIVLIGSDNFVHQNWLHEIDKRLPHDHYHLLGCTVDRFGKEEWEKMLSSPAYPDGIRPSNFGYLNWQGLTIPRYVIDDIGLLDENLHFYYYEHDYNQRLSDKKYYVGGVLESLMTTPQNMTRVGDLGVEAESFLPDGIDNYWTSASHKEESEYFTKKWGRKP